MRTAISFVLALAVAAGTLAAGTPSPAPESSATIEKAAVVERTGTFTNTFAELDKLVQALERAVVSGDADFMRQMAVTEEEFRDLVWPTLDIARLTNSGFTWDLSVGPATRCSTRSAWREPVTILPERRSTSSTSTFEGRTTDHGLFKIHRDSRVEVLRADGTRDEVALFGSLLETADGRYKIYSFINDSSSP